MIEFKMQTKTERKNIEWEIRNALFIWFLHRFQSNSMEYISPSIHTFSGEKFMILSRALVMAMITPKKIVWHKPE